MNDKKTDLSSLERSALVAEIVGAIAVVISIIYLGIQVGENTNALKVQTAHALLDTQFERASWYKDLDHVDLMIRGTSDPSSLTLAEWKKYSWDRNGAFNLWEQAHYGFLHGDLDDEQWESWDRSLVSSLCNPGTLLFWEEEQQGWGVPFQEHVNKHVEACQKPN